MRNFLRLPVLLALACFFWPVFCGAQPGDPGTDPDVPITGIEYLLGGGALYGLRQLVRKEKRTK